MSEAVPRVYNVLFLCTGNSARSLLAEAALDRLGSPRYHAFSAGSQPKHAPHPTTLATLEQFGYETKSLRSKSWDEFARADSPRIDFVFTVCGNAAGETCPVWPVEPMTAHWGVEDPAAFEGSASEEAALFERVYRELFAKVEALVAIDPAEHSRDELNEMLSAIGKRQV